MDVVPCEIFYSVLPRSCPLRHCMQRVLPPSESLKAPRGAWRNRNELPLLQAATASLRHRALFSSLIGGRKTTTPPHGGFLRGKNRAILASTFSRWRA